MQYEGQTSRLLKRRFTEHYRCMKKPGKIDIFFIDISNSLMNILDIFLFSWWKISYMTILRYKNSFMHELELKCVKFSKTPHPRGSNDNIYNF